jgi:hypothetical protein
MDALGAFVFQDADQRAEPFQGFLRVRILLREGILFLKRCHDFISPDLAGERPAIRSL